MSCTSTLPWKMIEKFSKWMSRLPSAVVREPVTTMSRCPASSMPLASANAALRAAEPSSCAQRRGQK